MSFPLKQGLLVIIIDCDLAAGRERSMIGRRHGTRIYRDYLKRHGALVRLSESDLIEQEIGEIVGGTDFRRLKLDDSISALNAKISDWERHLNRIILFTGLAALLLIASITGVKAEVTLLGIKLTDIERLKEAILIAIISTDLYYTANFDGIRKMKALRTQLLLKRYGEKQSTLLGILYSEDITSTMFTLFHKHYDPLFPRRFAEYILIGCLSIAILSIVSLVIGVQVAIVYDVFKESNFGPTWGAVLGSFAILTMAVMTGSRLLTTNLKFSYIDRRIASKVPFHGEDGKLLPEVGDFIVSWVRKRNRMTDIFISLFWLGLLISSLVALIG